ncbi:hypothetical protein PCANB_000894 [Pneumocystis canis]|nr:hypothetical protein PCANB_000894 [Pneumocystis canis]
MISEISDERFFSVDLKGGVDVFRKGKFGKCLKVDEIFSNKSFIPVLSDFFQKFYKNDMNKLKMKKQMRQKILGSEFVWSQKIKKKISNDLLNNIKVSKNQMVSKNSELYDIWAEPPNSQELSLSSFVPQKKRLKIPSTLHHSSFPVSVSVSNVKVTDPGMSYNPLFEQYQKLVENEVTKEILKIKNAEERKIFNTLKQDFIDSADSEKPFKDLNSIGEIDNSIVIRKLLKKTKRQRKKELRKKKEVDQYNKEILRKKQIRDLNSVDKIVKLIEEKENIRKMTNINNFKHDVGCKKFRRHAINTLPLEIQLLDELTDSFRLLKPEGNMFIDRFISLQERGFIEIRYPVVSYKKHRNPYVEKWSHKEIKL